MLQLKAKKRTKLGRQINFLRRQGFLPAVLYGEGVKSTPLEVGQKEFEKVFAEAGMSSLISLKLQNKEYQVLIHELSKDPLSGKFLHVDFYHPSSRKEVAAEVPLVFEREEEAQKESGGNLLKEIQTLEVKGLAQNLPREIKVDVSSLKAIDDRILVGNLKVPQGVKIQRDKEEIVAIIVPPREEEVVEEKPVEEEKEEEEKKEEGREGERK